MNQRAFAFLLCTPNPSHFPRIKKKLLIFRDQYAENAPPTSANAKVMSKMNQDVVK